MVMGLRRTINCSSGLWQSKLIPSVHVVMCLLGSGMISRSHRKAMKDARRKVLGPRGLRTPQKAVLQEDGTYGPDLPWEQDRRAANVGMSERCYSMVHSYQSQRNLVGPSVGAKIAMGEEPSDHLLMCEIVIRVSCLRGSARRLLVLIHVQAVSPLAMAALHAGDEQTVRAIELQAETSNLPRVGCPSNSAFPMQQMNLTGCKRADCLAREHHSGKVRDISANSSPKQFRRCKQIWAGSAGNT